MFSGIKKNIISGIFKILFFVAFSVIISFNNYTVFASNDSKNVIYKKVEEVDILAESSSVKKSTISEAFLTRPEKLSDEYLEVEKLFKECTPTEFLAKYQNISNKEFGYYELFMENAMAEYARVLDAIECMNYYDAGNGILRLINDYSEWIDVSKITSASLKDMLRDCIKKNINLSQKPKYTTSTTYYNKVLFGKTGDTTVEDDRIGWIVAYYDKKENKKLLISEYLATQELLQYDINGKHEWKDSTIRSYMKQIEGYFEDFEKDLIVEVDNTVYEKDSKTKKMIEVPDSEKVIDKIFVLSEKEINKYDSAVSPKAKINRNSDVYPYWLRDSDKESGKVSYVNEKGKVIKKDADPNEYKGLRIAVWVKVDE